ncbi:MAG: hypothetical protein FJ405_13890 [Verrucomicrobia bacterium]|nr:hypothetical protein [Verrucomicrobiota bacterium]
MKKHSTCLFTAALALAMSLNLNLVQPLVAQEPPPPAVSGETPPKPLEGRKLPFHGKLSRVNTEEKSITLSYSTGEKTYYITPETQILKEGQPASLAEAELGKQVSGAYVRQGDRMNLTKLNLTLRSDFGSEKARKAKKQSEKPAEQGASSGN